MSNKYGELTKNTAVIAVGNLSVKLINFFLLPLLTAFMIPSDYNTVELLTSTLELLLPFCMLSLQDAVFRFCMDKSCDRKAIFNSALAVTLGGAVLVFIGVSVLGIAYPQEYWVLFGVLYLLTALCGLCGEYVRGNEKIVWYSAAGIANAVALAAFMFLFVVVFDMGIIGYLTARCCADAVKLLMLVFSGGLFGAISPKKVNGGLLKEMVKFSMPLVPNNISWWLVHTVSRYVCTWLVGATVSGLYTAAAKLPSIINVFGAVFLSAWTISAVKTENDDNKSEFNSKVFNVCSCVFTLATSAVLVLLPFISRFLLQGEYYSAWSDASILILGAMLSCYVSYFGAFYTASKRTGKAFVSTLLGGIVNLVVAIGFVQSWGIHALTIATFLAYLVMAVFRLIDTYKYTQLKVKAVKEIATILLVCVQGFIMAFTREYNAMIQLGLFAVIVVVRCKDIVEILKVVFAFLGKVLKGKKAKRGGDGEIPLEENGGAAPDIKESGEARSARTVSADIPREDE